MIRIPRAMDIDSIIGTTQQLLGSGLETDASRAF